MMQTSAVSSQLIANGLEIHYVDWGNAQATPMVLIHGLRGYAYWFDEFAQAAKQSFRVLAYDQRGRGGSEWANDGNYTREAYLADLAAFVDALDLEQMILVGHSMGALNAIHYAARHPERVLALVDVDIGPEIDPAGMARIRQELRETPERFASWAQAAAFLEERHPSATAENSETRRRWMFKEAPEGHIDWRLDPAIFDPNLRHDPPQATWSALTDIRCPTLLVRGGVSDVFSVANCEEMVARMPDSRWVEIPDAGHMVIEDNPEAFNSAVMEFLRNVVSPVR